MGLTCCESYDNYTQDDEEYGILKRLFSTKKICAVKEKNTGS